MIKQSADYRNNRFPYPFGLEQIVYGDKVINIQNHRRYKVWPKEESLQYIANGEIGIVVGQTNFKGGGKPKLLNVDFSTQPGFSYTFTQSEFGEEKQASIELAYALTVHKCQGSEFGIAFIVIPDPCFLLSRELLYTALTRQKNKVIMFIQGNKPIEDVVRIRHSELEKRLTNLFELPNIIEYDEQYLDANLIHQASDGEMLRSKSELLIYEKLLNKNLEPIYEQPLIFGDEKRLPDFTIKDVDNGINYYWEHCGLMFVETYRKRWEEKRKWYIAHGINPYQERKPGLNGVLIESFEKPREVNGAIVGALSAKEIDDIISYIFG
jgi:hypothetical protein